MKRRAFFGLMGGAVAAGPKLAAEIASSSPSGLLPYAESVPCSSSSSGGDWRINQITRLRSLLSGESEEVRERAAEMRMRAAEMTERFRLDTLRAVSPSAKARMLVEFQVQHDAKQRRVWWQSELDNLLSGN